MTCPYCDNLDIYERAIDRWGTPAQVLMLIEECSELLTAIAQYDRGRVDDGAVAEEIADVFLMLMQMRHIMGHDIVDEALEFKLERLKKRLDSE